MINNINTLRNIKRAFKRSSIRSDFYQFKKNEFGEDEDKELVFSTNVIFYDEKTKINLNVSTNGKTTTKTNRVLMVLKDDKSELIKRHMTCTIKCKNYEIIDVKDDYGLDIYYTLTVREIDET